MSTFSSAIKYVESISTATEHYFEKRTNPEFPNEKPSFHEVSFEFLIGADGIHSKTRQQLMRHAQMSYQQTYDDIMWCEFQIPSNKGQHRLPPNHLHIWPSNESMFIANPSPMALSAARSLRPPPLFQTCRSPQTSCLPSSTTAFQA